MVGLGSQFFALFDVLGELTESTVEALLVGVVVVPFMSGLGAVLRVVVLGLIGLANLFEGLVIWCESSIRVVQAVEWSGNLGLVDQFLVGLCFFLAVEWIAFVLVGSKEMAVGRVSESLLHIVDKHSLWSSLDVAITISGVIGLVIEFLHVFEFRVFAECKDTYTNFCFPPAKSGWG